MEAVFLCSVYVCQMKSPEILCHYNCYQTNFCLAVVSSKVFKFCWVVLEPWNSGILNSALEVQRRKPWSSVCDCALPVVFFLAREEPSPCLPEPVQDFSYHRVKVGSVGAVITV